ncbi:phospholipid phosphatase 1 [Plakobranchus ocellatus]|uniref:Phospholipid phosphatase 1 n=1 Tax=Plakobranchus ocellatus TaxID=259542 RepID=A0AAV4DV36_9GAST|nr:phospholipid phosphatase 1 [Plakobranchus ocellatus]
MACFNGSGIRKRRNHIIKIIGDILCIGLVCGGAFAIQKGAGTYQRGFFCGDESIRYPVLPDTISVPLVLSVGLTLPCVVILAVEFAFRQGCPVMTIIPKSTGQKMYWLAAAYNAIAVFLFGSVVTQFLTELGKHSVGRLRPHFLSLCNPDLEKCSGYMTEFVCRSKDINMLREARLSFPSGHSSFALYSAVYLILYLEGRLACRAVVLAKPLVQLFFFALALYTCLSRISDYKHHWGDVLAGALLGTVVAISLVFSLTHFGKHLCKADFLCWSGRYEKDEEIQATELVSTNHQFENKFGHMTSGDAVHTIADETRVISIQETS